MKRILVLLAVVVLASASIVRADTVNPINDRPATVPTGALTSSSDGAGTDLQTILNTIYPGTFNAYTDQSPVGMWKSAASLYPTVTPILSFEYAGNADLNALGIWSGSDSNALKSLQIFSGPADPGTKATLSWVDPGSDTIQIACASGDCAGVNVGTFVNSGVFYTGFGYYLQTPGGTFYTVDSLNPGGEAQALAYQTNNDWVIAFEDLPVATEDQGLNSTTTTSVFQRRVHVSRPRARLDAAARHRPVRPGRRGSPSR